MSSWWITHTVSLGAPVNLIRSYPREVYRCIRLDSHVHTGSPWNEADLHISYEESTVEPYLGQIRPYSLCDRIILARCSRGGVPGCITSAGAPVSIHSQNIDYLYKQHSGTAFLNSSCCPVIAIMLDLMISFKECITLLLPSTTARRDG